MVRCWCRAGAVLVRCWCGAGTVMAWCWYGDGVVLVPCWYLLFGSLLLLGLLVGLLLLGSLA